MSEKSGGRAIVWVSVGVLIIVFAAGGYWLWHRSRPKPKPAPGLVTVGVGLYLGRDQSSHKFVVRKTFPNSPAEKAGLAPGTIINRINNVLAEEKTIKELSALLTGPVGTKVTLETIDTNGTTAQLEIVREQFVNRSTR